ncbi:MAG: CDP-alcohol phosphatidyltransferase family protein [Candidatus Omnitrophica bacterium]|nr:CDP-alcohol phosphatidyltransferase family protein [Candidatus Omnitrophota bacterium]
MYKKSTATPSAMNLPNWISLFRIILIPFFISAVVYYAREKDYLRYVALAIFSLAVFSDAVDGYIARTQRLKTRLGSYLDPIADKLLLSASFITLAVTPSFPLPFRPPLWVPIAVISRDAILILGSMLVYVMTGELKIVPSILGKLTTFFQMMTIIFVLLQFPRAYLIWNSAVFFTVVSGIDYLLRGTKLLSAANGNARNGAG